MKLPNVPNEWRMVLILGALAVILAGVSFQGGRASHATVINHTHIVRATVAQQYGKPSQSIDGAQINKNLSGLVCDVYQTKATIICHRP